MGILWLMSAFITFGLMCVYASNNLVHLAFFTGYATFLAIMLAAKWE